MRLLLTGFEPFGGSSVNPSQEVVRAIEEREATLQSRGIELHTCILPVEAKRGPASLLRTIDRVKPHAVICLGESGRAAAITIERVFINLADYRVADNAGTMLREKAIAAAGPAAYFTTLPIERLSDAVKRAGVPVESSLSAGAFLCNHVAYAMAHHLAKKRGNPIPAGFVHLPRLPEQVRGQRGKPMPLQNMVRGVEAMILELDDMPRKPRAKGR